MEKQVALILFSLFCGKALTLKCYNCLFGTPETCNTTLRECDAQCGSITVSAKAGGIQVDYPMSACLDPKYCINGRINTGIIQTSVNSKCCTTDMCNKELLPALPKQPSNGMKCCTNDDCSSTVSCDGDEDRCINATVSFLNFRTNVKGCATTSICTGLAQITHQGLISDISCCQKNLCNAAESFTLGFLLMLVSLFFSVLFH